MSSRRTVILIGAIVVGALAAFATLNYVSGVEDKAQGDARQVPVLVATDTIPEGMTVAEASSQGLIAESSIAQASVPLDAVDSTDQLGNKIAAVDISARTPITNSLWITQDQAYVTNSERIPTGMVAVTISVDQVRGVAGLIVPGDKVNLMVTTAADEGEAEAGGTSLLQRPAYTVYQGVHVLFVGNRAGVEEVDPAAEEAPDADQLQTAGSNLLTLAVPAEASEVIASVDTASIYLSLLPPDYTYEPLEPGPPAFDAPGQTRAPLPATDPNEMTAYGPDGFPEDLQ